MTESDEITQLEADERSGLLDVAALQEDKALRLEAHPGEKLMAHCLQVGIYARRLMREAPLRPPYGLRRSTMDKLAFLAGACHDLGKATSRFQRYLHTKDWREAHRLKMDPLTRHAMLGAVAAHAIVTHSDLDVELRDAPFGRILRLAPFWVIRRHHGNLLDPLTDLSPRKEDRDALSQQLKDCPQAEFDQIVCQISKVGDLSFFSTVTLSSLASDLGGILSDIGMSAQDITANELGAYKANEVASLEPWLLLQQLFSVLLAADKSYAAIEIRKPVRDMGMNAAWVDQYRRSVFAHVTRGVGGWRADAARIASANIEAAPIDSPFFQITLPTGLGKTLIALDCALRLRGRLRAAPTGDRTIIYALPFLTILEQAAGIVDDLFASALACEVAQLPSDLMIRHHHLAEMRYVQDEREFDPNQSQLMIEGWRSALVMTSTVQLFQSLFSGRNRTTRKLHRLAGAIVILDEVQTLPFKYWPLLRQAMRALNSLFDTRFILVTATQPRFLEMSGETAQAVEVVPSYRTYFERLSRTETRFDLKARSIGSFAQVVEAAVRSSPPPQDALVVVNTVMAATELFGILASRLGEDWEVIHLSTNVIPQERVTRIARVKNSGHRARPVLLVSTQLVEAGVDLSFPILFRDFAPFPSIVQAAGRANRSGEYAAGGRVFVYKLMGDNERVLASTVYDTIELNATDAVFGRMSAAGVDTLTEVQLIDAVEEYFAEIQPNSTRESYEVVQGAKALCFKARSPSEREALQSFRLIDDEDTQEVFIEIDDRAAESWLSYDQLLSEPFDVGMSLEARFARAGELRVARIKCLPFMLSVPRKYFRDTQRLANRKDEICYYKHDEIGRVYDLNTGWRRTERV
jgi:CRISPR-associated endonuclease/helicase Cas3